MNRVFGWNKRLGVLAVAALATGVLGLTAGSPAAQEAVKGGCDTSGPTTGPSPVITGGTRIQFNVKCKGDAAHSILLEVEANDQTVVRDKDTLSGNGQAELDVVKDIPGLPSVPSVCVTVNNIKQCAPPTV